MNRREAGRGKASARDSRGGLGRGRWGEGASGSGEGKDPRGLRSGGKERRGWQPRRSRQPLTGRPRGPACFTHLHPEYCLLCPPPLRLTPRVQGGLARSPTFPAVSPFNDPPSPAPSLTEGTSKGLSRWPPPPHSETRQVACRRRFLVLRDISASRAPAWPNPARPPGSLRKRADGGN